MVTNKKMRDALDHAEGEVRRGRIWVCLRVREFLCRDAAGDWFANRAANAACDRLEKHVQAYLNGAYRGAHHKEYEGKYNLDADLVCRDTNLSAAQLRLDLIDWLRVIYKDDDHADA